MYSKWFCMAIIIAAESAQQFSLKGLELQRVLSEKKNSDVLTIKIDWNTFMEFACRTMTQSFFANHVWSILTLKQSSQSHAQNL